MKKWSSLIAIVLLLGLLVMPGWASDTPSVLGLVEIRGLDALAGVVFDLTKSVGNPIPKEMTSMILYSGLGSMPGMGITPDGNVRVVWFESASPAGSFVLYLPVDNDGADYFAYLDQNGWENQGRLSDKIEHYSPPEDAGVLWENVYFIRHGATLVAADNPGDARKGESLLNALPPILPVEGVLAIQVRPAALTDTYGPLVREQMDVMVNDPDAPAQMEPFAKEYFDAYLQVAAQVDEVVLGVGVANDKLNLHYRAAPIAGTTLARWMDTIRAPGAASAVVALPGALIVSAVNMGDFNMIAGPYLRFMEKALKSMPQEIPEEFITRYMALEKAGYEQLVGDISMALLPPKADLPLRFVEYANLKDVAATRGLFVEGVNLFNDGIAAMLASVPEAKESGVNLTATLSTPRTYRDIPVDQMRIAIELPEEAQAEWPAFLPRTFTADVAWLADGAVFSVGDPALIEPLVDRALDGATDGVTSLPAWKAAFPNPETPIVEASHIALFDTIRSFVQWLDAATGENHAPAIPAGPGNVESASYLQDGYMSQLRINLADLGAIGAKISEAREKAIQQRQLYLGGDTNDWYDLDDTDEDEDSSEETPAAE